MKVQNMKHIRSISFTILVLLIFSNLFLYGQKAKKSGLIEKDLLSRELTLHSSNISIGQETGLIRYVYSKIPGRWQGNPETAAISFLKMHGIHFGVDNPEKMLSLQQIQNSPAGHHVIYTQTLNGIPVHQSDLVITLNDMNEVVFIASTIKNDLQPQNFTPKISKSIALNLAREHIKIKGKYFTEPETELMILSLKEDNARLTFRVRIATNDPRGDWEVFVDALDGKIIHARNRIMHQDYVTGRGAVFNPDPLTMAGVYYGGDYSDPDGSDQDNEFLNAQRIMVELPEILVQDNLYSLSGPYVRLEDIEKPDDVFPVLTNPDSFIYTRSEQEFEDVMVYYHIDKSYRYLMSLEFDIPGLYEFRADPHGAQGEDNSYYMGGSANFCVFGEGGVDDAEDAAVIWHEYAHAIQENIIGMTYIGETKSLQEGSSDYWATSYSISQFEFGWQHVFMWDAGIVSDESTGIFWPGRRSDTDMRYPDDYDFIADSAHSNGQIWSSALMHVQNVLGKEITDKLFIRAHYLWGSSPGFEDAARAFIQTDSLLYGGVHTSFIVPWFTHHGLIKLDDYLPVISHQPLTDTEDIYGPYHLSVDIFPGKAVPDTTNMWVSFWFDDLPVDSVPLQKDSLDNTYFAELPGPGKEANINYYIFVTDSLNSIVLEPMLAPLNYFSFYAGPDTIPPIAVFSPLTDQSIIRWPAEVIVYASDNIGIGNIRVNYYINTPVNSDSFFLEYKGNDVFSGFFPADPDSIMASDSVFYQIEITDLSYSHHKTVLPDSGMYTFEIVSDGGILTFSFELDTVGFSSNGDWQWGIPTNGPQSAYDGEKLWATRLNQIYSDSPGLSELIIPEIDLKGFNHVTLQFWHWYEIEQKFDGGNIKIRSDQHPDWQLLIPVEGYDVIIDTSFGNPIAGECGFSGKSDGWISSRFNIDIYKDEKIEIRFDFGTDVTESGLGWYLDLLTISDKEAIIATPEKLQVTDHRDKITLEWEAPATEKVQYTKSGMMKNKKTDRIEDSISITGGLPAFYIYRSLSGVEYSVLDSTTSTTFSDSLVKPGFTYYYYVTFSNGESESLPSDTVSAVVEPITLLDKESLLPETYGMFQNYPNPFNPSTTIRYQMPDAGEVDVSVYNLLGEKIITLVSEYQVAGRYRIEWTGLNESGNHLPSGLYFYQIRSGSFRKTMKMILIR